MTTRQRTIIVGVDATDEGRRALDWARSEATADDVIVAVHVWSIPAYVGLDSSAVTPAMDFGQLAEQGLAELLDGLDDGRIVGVTPYGHAGRAIVEEAEHRDADLVVVGHQGSGRASVVLGSTANHVAHHTERPVVVVRGRAGTPAEHIVVGVDDHGLDDGENASVRALRFACSLPTAKVIDVAHSWFVPAVALGRFSNPGGDFEELDDEAIEVARRVIAAVDIPDHLTVRPRPLNGTPEFALIEASRDADLVVVGSRGRGGFAGLLLGSTSLRLASFAHCPVAIVE